MSKEPKQRKVSLLTLPNVTPITSPAPDNMKERQANLNFKVAPDFKRQFRKIAAENDMSLKELLEEALDEWKKAKEH